MHSLEDDSELDQVARKAADAYEAPGKANWNKMQLILDKEMPEEKRKKRFIFWFLPALFICGALVFFTIQQKHNSQINQEISSPKPSVSKEPSIQSKQISSSKTIAPKKIEPLKESTDFLKSNLVEAKTVEAKNVETKPFESFTLTNKTDSVTNEIIAINNTNQAFASKDTVKQPLIDSEMAATLDKKDSVTISRTEFIDTTTLVKSAQSVPIKANNYKGFFVGVTAGIDISTVNYNYQNGIGYNFGAQFGYRFNKHWSIQTGALYTQKKYKLNGSDFHPPKGSWIANYPLETVSGACYMWDIPIMVTYHFNGSEKIKPFLSIGSSSYFMQNEDYNYYYIFNNQPYYRSASYETKEQYLFSIIHISAGIEKTMGKNLTAIIEPYAKLPLAGVGYGSIELSSFGLNFSLRYKQPK